MTLSSPEIDPDRDLRLTLDLSVDRQRIWRCWQEPELFSQWFAPLPWTCDRPQLELRQGGYIQSTMRGPDGEQVPLHGQFLDVIPARRLVMTDAYLKDWQAASAPFMTLILTLEDLHSGETRYDALVKHWSKADCDSHVDMGFAPGWTQCIRQLETLAQSLEDS